MTADAPVRPIGLIVADDLTGAADTCVTFVRRGHAGVVSIDARAAEADREAMATGADWIAASTDTRTAPVTTAVDRVREVVEWWRRTHPSARLFKKIDSTLRGHVRVELIAAIDGWHAGSVVVLTPAFPAMGRTVDRGLLHVAGVGPHHLGALSPIDVIARLESQGVTLCGHVARPEPDHRAWRDAMADAFHDDTRVLVCDAVTDDDLDAIVAAASTFEGERPVIWSGAAGLAGALARHLRASAPDDDARANAHARADAMLNEMPDPRAGSVVFWIGSNHPATLEQQRALLSDASQGHGRVDAILPREIDRLAERLDRGEHVLIDMRPATVTKEADVDRIASIVHDRPVAGFVMSGGDTAARVCRALDAVSIRLGGEVRRGMPWGWLETRSGRRWPVVLKSGAFGTDRALHEILAFLTPAPAFESRAGSSPEVP